MRGRCDRRLADCSTIARLQCIYQLLAKFFPCWTQQVIWRGFSSIRPSFPSSLFLDSTANLPSISMWMVVLLTYSFRLFLQLRLYIRRILAGRRQKRLWCLVFLYSWDRLLFIGFLFSRVEILYSCHTWLGRKSSVSFLTPHAPSPTTPPLLQSPIYYAPP